MLLSILSQKQPVTLLTLLYDWLRELAPTSQPTRLQKWDRLCFNFVVGVYPYVRQLWPVLFTFFFWVSRSFLYNFPVLSVFGIILIWLSKTWAKCALSRVKSLRSLIKRAMSCYRFAHWALPVCRFSVTHVCLVTFCSVWCKTINAINKLCPVCLKCKTGNGAGDSFTVKVITCTTRSWSF